MQSRLCCNVTEKHSYKSLNLSNPGWRQSRALKYRLELNFWHYKIETRASRAKRIEKNPHSIVVRSKEKPISKQMKPSTLMLETQIVT